MRKVLERIVNLLAFLLTAGRPVTAEEIRFRVAGYADSSDEAFHRMFERDKALLRRMGVPLVLEHTDAWEVEQGYVIAEEAFLDGIDLTDEERAALLLAAQLVRLGGTSPGADAILKLGGAPLVDTALPFAADLGAEAEPLAVAFGAAADRHRMRFTYRERDREVEPYGLIHQRGHWYLVARDLGHDDVRSFRVDRMERPELIGEPGAFERPEGFRLRDALPRKPWEAGEERLVAEVTFDPSVAWLARRQLPEEVIAERPDGGVDARIDVANPDAFVSWILTFGPEAEVIGPASLRRQVVERIEASR